MLYEKEIGKTKIKVGKWIQRLLQKSGEREWQLREVAVKVEYKGTSSKLWNILHWKP